MKVLLGISGSIAAYKALLLTRLLVKNGHQVKVVMTKDAMAFVQPLSFSTLSKNKVYHSFYNEAGSQWNNHVDLGLWADVMLIAPATANTLSKMANGLSDNILLATYLSARCPVWVAPAMDLDMWKHPSTQRNITQLKNDQVHIIDVEDGELASGLSGKGRMAEPEHIFEQLTNNTNSDSISKPLAGKTVIVSAGPTYEAIDPVRFIGNHSSGKMGIALADAAAKMGATVHLVLGPSTLTAQHSAVKVNNVVSTNDMFQAITSISDQADIIIMAAAVSDYTPMEVSTEKLKKKEGEFAIPLKRTQDILFHLGQQKPANQLLIGFALETTKGLEYAEGKLKKKNLDLIVLNSLKDKNAGFKHDTNKVTFIDRHNKITKFELKSKAAVAVDILNKVIELNHA